MTRAIRVAVGVTLFVLAPVGPQAWSEEGLPLDDRHLLAQTPELPGRCQGYEWGDERGVHCSGTRSPYSDVLGPPNPAGASPSSPAPQHSWWDWISKK